MSTSQKQDLEVELDYQRRQASLLNKVRPTPIRTLKRYRDHNLWRLHSKDCLFRMIADRNPTTVCDFGCGDGGTSTELAWVGYQVTGFDLSPELIEIAKERARLDQVEDRVEFLIADAKTCDLKKESFDVILVQAVLHHLVDLEASLDQLKSLLKPNGAVVILEPINFSKTLARLRDRVPVEKDISPNERQLEEADIEIIAKHFNIVERRYFRLLARMERFIPERWSILHQSFGWFWRVMDAAVLMVCPPLGRLAGSLAMVAVKKQHASADPEKSS